MKPIAWYDPTNGMVSADKDSPLFTPLGQVWPLYLQSEQEPIGYASEGAAERLTAVKQAHEQIRSFRLFIHDVPLYTAPQRTWVGLTEEELYEIYDESDDGSSPCGVCGACSKCKIEVAIARAIQSKLKEKNVQR